jgi:hypothetical protein
MGSQETFAVDVARDFAFLETEYGMRREPMHVSGGSSWVVYANATVRVIVEHELGGYCGVTVQNLRHVKKDPLERAEFDLDEIVAAAPGPKPRRQDPRSMTEAVAKAAQTLKTLGGPVLNGAFDELQNRQRKAVEALRRHNPLE